MPIQRESDSEPDDVEEPVVIPQQTASEAKLAHLARMRQRKAELAQERAQSKELTQEQMMKQEQKQKERLEALALSRGVKKIKDPAVKEVIKKEILKATALRQPKVPIRELCSPNPNLGNNVIEKELKAPIQQPKPKKQPQVVVEESEPEVIIVKRPKKKIVIEETETETEPEYTFEKGVAKAGVRGAKLPEKTRRTPRRRPQPIETESEFESEYDVPPPPKKAPMRKQPLKPPTAFPGFQINF